MTSSLCRLYRGQNFLSGCSVGIKSPAKVAAAILLGGVSRGAVTGASK